MARFKRGSTPKLTSELIETVSAAIRNGAYVETAVALAGISKDSFYRWLRDADGRNPNPMVVALSDAVKKALAEGEMRDLQVIDNAAQGGERQLAKPRGKR